MTDGGLKAVHTHRAGSSWRNTQAAFEGMCKVCGAEVLPGQKICWNQQDKRIVHYLCHGDVLRGDV